MNKYLPILFPLLIIFAGLALRIPYLEEIRHTPEFKYPLYDPEYNAYWAKGLATDDWTVPSGVRDPEIRTTPHGRPPGYPWFLFLIYRLFGVSDTAPRIVQMLLGLVNALLLYSLGKRIFGAGTGFLAGLMMALYWVFPYYEGLLTYPALAIFLLLCLFHCLRVWLRQERFWPLALSGILLGAFALLRPNGLLLLPLLLLWILLISLRKKVPLRRLCFSLVLPPVCCIAAVAPAFIRDYVVARDLVFISSYGGINLYVGNHPNASLVEPRIPELMTWAGVDNWSCFDYPAIVRGLAAQQGLESMRFSEANRNFYRAALHFITERPGLFFANLIRKMLLFWGPVEITNDTVPAWDKYFSRILHPLPGFPWFFALFLLGTVCLLVDKEKPRKQTANDLLLFLWMTIPVYCLSVILYFVAGRYRVPVIPMVLLFGAYGIGALARSYRAKHYKKALALTVLLILFFMLSHWHMPGYEASEATWHLRHALACSRSGMPETAEASYLKALEKGADSAVVYANLGRIHVQRGDREGGMALYRRGLEEHPDNAILHNNLGYELYREGKREEAQQHYLRAIEKNPRLALVRINLGHLLAEEGNREEALAQYEEALRLEPQDYAALYNCARLYFESGRTTEAIRLYRRVVSLRPDWAEALNNLGYCYATVGQITEALHCYERAVSADPSYTLAWNNLGNARLAMGDEEGAHSAYAAALKERNDDIYALHNLARLFEKQGHQEEAASYCEKVLAIAPDYVPALELLKKLKQTAEQPE